MKAKAQKNSDEIVMQVVGREMFHFSLRRSLIDDRRQGDYSQQETRDQVGTRAEQCIVIVSISRYEHSRY